MNRLSTCTSGRFAVELNLQRNASATLLDLLTCSGSFMETSGYCQKGDTCTFAHTNEELQNGHSESCLETAGETEIPGSQKFQKGCHA